MVYVGNKRLVGEVINLTKDMTTIQVYEETTELKFKIRNENTIKTIITEVFVCTTIYMLLLVFLVKNKEKLGKEKYTKVKNLC